MDIRFISSLTAEDEDVFAPAVLKAVSVLLDQLPIAYTLRIETTRAQVYQHTRTVPGTLQPVRQQIGTEHPLGATPFAAETQEHGAFIKYFRE